MSGSADDAWVGGGSWAVTLSTITASGASDPSADEPVSSASSGCVRQQPACQLWCRQLLWWLDTAAINGESVRAVPGPRLYVCQILSVSMGEIQGTVIQRYSGTVRYQIVRYKISEMMRSDIR